MKDAIKLTCLVILTLAGTATLLEVKALLHDVRLSVRMSDVTLSNLTATAKSLSTATDAETAKLQAVTEETRKTERAFRAGIDSLRQVFIDVHQQVVPQVTQTIADLDSNENRVTKEALKTIEGLQPSLNNLAVASAAAASDLSSPAIPQTLENVHKATESLSGVSRDAKDASDLALAKLREATKPASLAKRIFLTVIQYGYQFRGLLGL